MRRRLKQTGASGPFADLHVHLVPAVDDGPATMEETLAMLRAAHRSGTRRMVATPHLFSPHFPSVAAADLRRAGESMLAALRKLEASESNAFLRDMTIGLGAEHYVTTELFKALGSGEVLPLDTSRYLLIELSYYQTPEFVHTAISRIQDAGFTPVLAHVERYPLFEAEPSHLERLAADGCVLQVNAESVLGGWRSPLRRRVRRLLATGVVHLVASDGHNLGRRPPELAAAHEVLGGYFPAELVTAWMWQNPAAILENRPLPAQLPTIK